MRRKSLTFGLALLLVLAFGFLLMMAQTGPVKSQFTETPKKIDGQIDDWEGANFQNFKEANVDYAVANDDSHLFIVLVFHDREGMSTIEGTGVKVYISQPGKKNKDVAFHFRREQVQAEEAIARLESFGEKLTEEIKAQIREKKGFVFYEGAPVGKKIKAELEKIKGQRIEIPIFRYLRGRDKTVYEFRIPLQLNPALAPILEPGKPYNLGLEWGGMTDAMKRALMEKAAQVGEPKSALEGGDREDSGAIPRDRDSLNGGKGPKKFNLWILCQLAGAE